jgi:DNA transformation protein and related proteins
VDREALEDLFRPFGPVQIKRMFGGLGVFADGLMFALVTRGELHMKTDGESELLFEAAGSAPFVYEREGRDPVKMGYYTLPEDAYEVEDEFLKWARLAHTSALKAAAAKQRTAGSGKPAIAKKKPHKSA